MQSLWMVVAALFYALYGVAIKFAAEYGINSWQCLFYRSLFGTIVFFLMLRLSGITVMTAYPLHHTIRSVAGTLAMLFAIYSMVHLNLGLAMTLNYTAPLFLGAFVVAYSIYKGRSINWGLIGALIAGFVGVVVLLGPTLSPKEYGAAVIGLMAGFCTAVATGYVKKLGALHEPEARIIFWLVLIGTIVSVVGVVFTGGFTPLTATSAMIAFGLAAFASLGQFCLTRAFSRGNMVLASSLQYTVILFSTILGEILFNEPATVTGVIGMCIIVASGLLASMFVRRENKRLALKTAGRQPAQGTQAQANGDKSVPATVKKN